VAQAVKLCRANGEFLAALAALYDRVDAAVAEKDPPCRACGKCCDFDGAGHRLYVTAGELVMLLTDPPPKPPGQGCPYQVDNLCAARQRRPLGCRAFFCDPGLADWSHALYERWHGHVRSLHEHHGLPYLYTELRTALRQALPR
jgi:hypothetical protein